VIREIEGGITAPRGFRAAGVACGLKKRKPEHQTAPLDLALIVADAPASAAAVFTTNKAVAAPVTVSREHLIASGGVARVVVVNSGCANACTGAAGLAAARDMAATAAAALGCPPDQVLVSSTGVIGAPLDITKIKAGIAHAHRELGPGGRRRRRRRSGRRRAAP